MVINPEDIIYNQENDYSCGAVCLRWIYDKFGFEYKMSQSEMESITKTYSEGCTHKSLIAACDFLNIDTYVENNLDRVAEFLLNENTYAIVGWTPWGEHYSVIESVTKDFVVLNDPASPSCISVYSRKEFEKVWFDSENSERKERWCLIINPLKTK